MSDIAKLIDDSITSVISEVGNVNLMPAEGGGSVADAAKKTLATGKKAIEDIKSGKLGEMAYDKLNPEKSDLAFETVKKLAKKNKENEDMGVGTHLAKAGKKAVEAIKEHPGIAAATAAALAAGVGGVAAVKKMRKAAKK